LGYLVDDAGGWHAELLDKAGFLAWDLDRLVIAADLAKELAGFGRRAIVAGEADLLLFGLLRVGVLGAGLHWLETEANLVGVLDDFCALNRLSLIVLVDAAASLLVFFVAFIALVGIGDWLVFLTAMGIFQIGTALVVLERVALVEALDVLGVLVVVHAVLILGVVIVVSAKTALSVLVEWRKLDPDLFTIESNGDILGVDADHFFALLNTIVAEGLVIAFTFSIDLNMEFVVLGFNLDDVLSADHFEFLFVVGLLLHHDGEAWALAAAVLGQNGVAFGKWGLEGDIVEG